MLLGLGAGAWYLLSRTGTASASGGSGAYEGPYTTSEGISTRSEDDQSTVSIPTRDVMDPNWVQANQMLTQAAISQGSAPVAKQILQAARTYQLSSPQLYSLALASSTTALQNEVRLLQQESSGQIHAYSTPTTSLSSKDKATLNSISTQGGLASAFASQVKSAGTMSAMDRQIAKNYATKRK